MIRKVVLFLFLLVLLPGWLFSSSVVDVKARKKLVVLSYPHAYNAFVKEKEPGHYDGVDVSIMKTFANKLGVAMEIHAVPSLGDLVPALLEGKGDILASGFSITPEREKVISFSDPYFAVVVMVIVRKDSPIAGLADLKGKKGSVVPGSSKEARLKAIPGAIPYHVEKSIQHYEAVEKGKADFALVDSPSWLANEESLPNLKVGFQLAEVEYYGYGMMKDSDLAPALNAHLKEMRQSGTMNTLLRRALGDKVVEMMKLIKE
jgi:polar amino acid transport system substrate-binding protein